MVGVSVRSGGVAAERRSAVGGSLHPLSPVALADAHPDRNRHADSYQYSNHYPHPDQYVASATSTKRDSGANQHGHARTHEHAYVGANSHPYAKSRADRIAHPDSDDALTVATPVGSVSQRKETGAQRAPVSALGGDLTQPCPVACSVAQATGCADQAVAGPAVLSDD
jgi:hypothetical protein